MNPYEDRLNACLQYLYHLCPKVHSMTEAQLRLMVFWADWHHATTFGAALSHTEWRMGELGPESSLFTEATTRLWGGNGVSDTFLTNEEKISLDGAVQALGLVGVRQSMEEVRQLWVSRRAVWSHPIHMLSMAEEFHRLSTDPATWESTKEMAINRNELLSGEYSADCIPLL